MKKNGFTLIELLAVILILGIIAIIAIPTVTEIITESKLGAAEATGNSMVKSGEVAIRIREIKGDSVANPWVSGTVLDIADLDLEGKKPADADSLVIVNTNNEVYVYYTLDGFECTNAVTGTTPNYTIGLDDKAGDADFALALASVINDKGVKCQKD